MISSELAERVRHGLREYRLWEVDDRPEGIPVRSRLREAAEGVAIGLGRSSLRSRQLQFDYRGFRIPLDLAAMTGGSQDTWDEIAQAHLGYYERWAPVSPDSRILEVGCGIGRDAMCLRDVLGPHGSYLGLDITEPSIRWCQRNITAVDPRFRFEHLDVASPMYNPLGRESNTSVRFPADDASNDRVFLHSVFTHMYPPDVGHYLEEMRRVLTSDGIVLASFFVVDEQVMAHAVQIGSGQTFEHDGPHGSRIHDPTHPEAAVGLTLDTIEDLASNAGLEIRGLHRGFWSGMYEGPNGQDVITFVATG
ncbi:MAG: class I SAM-dependent methyltransferase [Microthrixaceae bacterium]